MAREKSNYIIRSRHQMRALAAPTRQEIVDVLPRIGTVSVAELANALGRPADSLYYHLRILEKVGLVRVAGSRRSNGRLEVLFRAIARDLRLHYQLGRKGNGSEVTAIIASMLRLGIRDFRKIFRTSDASVSGPARELWALRKTNWLSKREIREVNRYIEKIAQIMAAPKRNGRLYAVTIVLTPLARRLGRRNHQGSSR